jgi:FkbM family methyltransferase
LGTYEVDRLRAFADCIHPGATVYDVGANVGIYSLLASVRVGPAGKVYAFEPLERNLGYLRRHMTLNRVQNCVVLDAAVSDSDALRRFSTKCWDFSMGRLSEQGDVEVATVTLDSCIYREKGLRPPDTIKIDVEGGELEVLQGATRTFTEFHPVVFLEVHGRQLHVDCCTFLVAKGYQVKEGYGQIRAVWRPTT